MTGSQRLLVRLRRFWAWAVRLGPVRFLHRLASVFVADDVGGLAAEMSYRFLFALFPFLIFLAALVGFVGTAVGEANLFGAVMELATVLAPPEIQEVIGQWARAVVFTQSPGLLTLGVAGSFLGAGAGMATLVKGLNRAHGVTEGRPFWQTQLLVWAGVSSLSLVMLGGVVLLATGEWVGRRLAPLYGVDHEFLRVWEILRGPAVTLALFCVLLAIYIALPSARVPMRCAVPGALVATAAWILATNGFSLYLSHFGEFDRTYGSLGAAIVLMVWIYAVSAILLVGGEINALVAGHRLDGPRPPCS